MSGELGRCGNYLASAVGTLVVDWSDVAIGVLRYEERYAYMPWITVS